LIRSLRAKRSGRPRWERYPEISQGGSFGHALATGRDPWSQASLGVSTTSVRIASWYSKPLIFPGQLCMAKSSSPAAAVALLSARFSHSRGINVSLASLGLCARTCERFHGLFSPGSRPTASSQTLSVSPTELRARWACGLMVLGTTSVCTSLGVVGFPVRCGPPGRSEERNGRSEERNGRSEERNGRSEERNGRQPGSACRWPEVFRTQAIRLRPMTLFNPVFNCVTPKGIKR